VVVVGGGQQESLASSVGPEKGRYWVQVMNEVKMEWPRRHWY